MTATPDFQALALAAVDVIDEQVEALACIDPHAPVLAERAASVIEALSALRRRLATELWSKDGVKPTRSGRMAALELAKVLERHGFTADAARRAHVSVWRLAAEASGLPAPDEATRNAVITVLALRDANPDPFASYAGSDQQ